MAACGWPPPLLLPLLTPGEGRDADATTTLEAAALADDGEGVPAPPAAVPCDDCPPCGCCVKDRGVVTRFAEMSVAVAAPPLPPALPLALLPNPLPPVPPVRGLPGRGGCGPAATGLLQSERPAPPCPICCCCCCCCCC